MDERLMHDWSLRSIDVDWKTGEIWVSLQSSSREYIVRAFDLSELRLA